MPRLSAPGRRPPAGWRWPACRRAAAWRRRRRTGGRSPARRGAGRCGRGRRRRAAVPGSPSAAWSARRPRRRRYWPAARRMRAITPRSASGSPTLIAVEPSGNVGGCVGRAQRVAFLQQRREVGRQRALCRGFRRQQHRRQTGMRAELGHAAAGPGNAAGGVQGAQLAQQRLRRRQRPGRWLVLEQQRFRPGAPGGAIQRQAGEFGLQDFRPVERRQAAMQRGGPQADRDARRFPPGAAGALVRCGAGDAQRGQPGEAAAGIQPRRAPPAAVDDDAHARHGQ